MSVCANDRCRLPVHHDGPCADTTIVPSGITIHGAYMCPHGRVLAYDVTSEVLTGPEINGCDECTPEQVAFDSRYVTAEQLTANEIVPGVRRHRAQPSAAERGDAAASPQPAEEGHQ